MLGLAHYAPVIGKQNAEKEHKLNCLGTLSNGHVMLKRQ